MRNPLYDIELIYENMSAENQEKWIHNARKAETRAYRKMVSGENNYHRMLIHKNPSNYLNSDDWLYKESKIVGYRFLGAFNREKLGFEPRDRKRLNED